MLKTFLSYLIPQRIAITSSEYNYSIEVKQINGALSLFVNGIQQTGPYVESIFNNGFEKIGLRKFKNVKEILILGLGGGYVVKRLYGWFPESEITVVDIDHTIVEIAQKYFDVPVNRHIQYLVSDAKDFVDEKQNVKTFDLIVIDLYIGDDIPDFLETQEFFRNIKKLMSKNGSVYINYQGTERYDKKRKDFESMLSEHFKLINIRIKRNEMIFLSKKS